MKIIYTDVLVIGGGLAGLRIAIGAKRRGHDTIILSLVPPKRSHSAAAQGGMQASLANVIMGQGDGCMSLLGCHDVCPKNLPLATQIAFLRRKMVAQGFK
jgi:glycine/D-amino acid oxidase-like deaminating enzyme